MKKLSNTTPQIKKLAEMERNRIEDSMTSQLMNCFVGDKTISYEQREIMDGFIRYTVKEELDKQSKRFNDELLKSFRTVNLDFLKKYEGEE